jgi:hypothetical protein
VVFYVSTNSPPPDDLYAAVAIATVGGSIDNVTIGSGG